jgi:ribonuclease VapC
MIAVDTSALVAIFMDEPDRQAYASAIADAGAAVVPTTCILEASIKAYRVGGADMDEALDALVKRLKIEVVPVGTRELAAARDAFRRFGKGTGHPAALNFGDCFSYALAKTRDLPLLFKGADFAATDIRSALA